MKTSAERRKKDFAKATRKKNISEQCNGFERYDNLHQYSKNKIHCSCPLCSAKTGKYGNTPNYKLSDQRKVDEMNSKLEEM